MRLNEIAISGFRGFRKGQTISLDADIVLVHGPNGTGKSSIVEALEYLLFGRIARHYLARSPSEYQGSLRNIHCQAKEKTYVELTISIDDTEHVLRRDYVNMTKSTLSVNGEVVDDFSVAGVSIEESRKPILSQGEIRSVVDVTQVNRHNEIAEILGLDILGDFRLKLRELKKNTIKHAIISQATKSTDASLQEMHQYAEFGPFCKSINEIPYNQEIILKNLFSCVGDVCKSQPASVEECLDALKRTRGQLVVNAPKLSAVNALNIPEGTFPIAELVGASQQIANICDQLSAVAKPAMELHLAHFLQDGLTLAADTICPFCLQPTLTDARIGEIQESLAGHKTGLELETQLSEELARFSSQWQKVVEDLLLRIGIQTQLRAAIEEAAQIVGENTETESLRRFHDITLPELHSKVDKLIKEVEQFKQATADLINHKASVPLLELISLAKDIHRNIPEVCTSVHEDIHSLAGVKMTIMTKTPGISPEVERELKQIMTLETLIQNLGNVRLARIYQTRINRLQTMQTALEAFENTKMSDMLSDLSTEICDYYNKLNPDEPITFTGMVTGGEAHRQVHMEGESYGQKFNPVSCFSEAHANCLGLSMYLTQRVSRNPQCRFFVLDDPIQSMDEEHADHLSDVLREISQHKQLIILSHQKSFCDLLDDVFRHRRYIKYTCNPYTKDGPQIESEGDNIEGYLVQAKTHSRALKKEDRINNGIGSVRKAIEAIAKELLIEHSGVKAETLRTDHFRLNRRLKQLENSGFDKDDLANMRSILPISHPPHHDDPNWDVSPARIERAVKLLDTICKKYGIGQYQSISEMVGRVINYFQKLGVAGISITKPISVNDKLLIKGTTTLLEMTLDSMELEKQGIATAQPGNIVGIKVPEIVRRNDFVYKLET